MFEQVLLREQLQELLCQEQQAVQFYADLAARLADPPLRRQAEQVHREKLRHLRLAERLLEIME